RGNCTEQGQRGNPGEYARNSGRLKRGIHDVLFCVVCLMSSFEPGLVGSNKRESSNRRRSEGRSKGASCVARRRKSAASGWWAAAPTYPAYKSSRASEVPSARAARR